MKTINKSSCMLSAALFVLAGLPSAGAGAEGAPAHEAAEDAARTVPGGASKGVKACHDDIERFCGAVKPGQGRLGRCLKKNAKKLSRPCRDWLAHGGQAHVDKAYRELDVSSGPAKAPASRP